MDVHVVSTLTLEDEDRLADAVISALADLFDELAIAYALRIETSSTKVIRRVRAGASVRPPKSPNVSDISLHRYRDSSRRDRSAQRLYTLPSKVL